MAATLSLLLVIAISMLVTKVATVALVHTGLSRESARFQARSAFTGAGFTTRESEAVVRHPVRRRILMWLMLLGNAGVVTAVSALVLSFAGQTTASLLGRLGLITAGIAGLLALAWSPLVDRSLSHLIGRALRRYTHLDTRDYAELLHLQDDFGVKELEVEEGDWLEGRTLGEARLAAEGALVLGLKRESGLWIGAPHKHTRVEAGDVLILYGRDRTLLQLDCRRDGSWGDREHERAMQEHRRLIEEEQRREAEDPASLPPVTGEGGQLELTDVDRARAPP